MGCTTSHFFCPAPWGPGEGPKGQISLNSFTKSISRIFKPNFVCLLRNERYKTYQMGFSFGHLGHAPGAGLWGTVGGQKIFLSKFNQNGFVSYLHECHMQGHQFLGPRPLGPWGGAKRPISLNLNYKVNFKVFLTKLCVSSHK